MDFCAIWKFYEPKHLQFHSLLSPTEVMVSEKEWCRDRGPGSHAGPQRTTAGRTPSRVNTRVVGEGEGSGVGRRNGVSH